MKALHHVGITVKDLDASVRFYHDVLGLGFSNEPSPWFEGPGLGPAVGVPGAALRTTILVATLAVGIVVGIVVLHVGYTRSFGRDG